MLKQITASLMALTLLLSGGAGALAATDVEEPKGMEKAVEKHLEKEFYDFHKTKNAVDLSETIKVEATPQAEDGKEASGPITVYASLAKFQTVRDDIYTFSHREVVYYDATNKKVLTGTEVGKLENDKLIEYKDSFAHLGKKMNLGWILSLHGLILLIPAYFMFVWGNQVYSSTSFQIRNNIYNQKHTFN
ncbi:hypothetical protein [Pseudalkalibacillus berkeleyi]|uniref:Uncharacterized protein n=1 Tax=Pseudalkalibacillus berkeleyi TaxID=1069813 RepID=A0ABS9H063_9BACL|nr:hypothetical protein [Pseudalkalibacillus berkeleyi]MCF6138324.1 hypothetical protein [Pseudalkalibacillus berkeleyi]